VKKYCILIRISIKTVQATRQTRPENTSSASQLEFTAGFNAVNSNDFCRRQKDSYFRGAAFFHLLNCRLLYEAEDANTEAKYGRYPLTKFGRKFAARVP